MEANLINRPTSEVVGKEQLSNENRLEIIDEGIRKKYLARLSDMPVAPVMKLPPIENDVINNVRMYHVKEMVYQKGEPVTDKFTTVFNTLSTYNVLVLVPTAMHHLPQSVEGASS